LTKCPKIIIWCLDYSSTSNLLRVLFLSYVKKSVGSQIIILIENVNQQPTQVDHSEISSCFWNSSQKALESTRAPFTLIRLIFLLSWKSCCSLNTKNLARLAIKIARLQDRDRQTHNAARKKQIFHLTFSVALFGLSLSAEQQHHCEWAK